MRILVISAVSPQGPSQGERLRLENLMRGVEQVADADLWSVSLASKPFEVLKSFALTRSVYWARNIFHPADIPDRSYDVVISFQLRTAPLAAMVRGEHRILDLTDSLGLFRQRLQTLHTGYLRQAVLWNIDASEVTWAGRFDEVWVSGWKDALWLKQHGIAAYEVANAVHEKEMLPSGDPHELLFVANLAYLPNRHGIRRFLRHVWPLLEREGYHLHLVGQGSELLHGRGVSGYGFMVDLKAMYRKTGISISPVELGTGTQNKILEAMGYGRPVVSGPEGFDALPENLRAGIGVAGNPEEWVSQLRGLQDPTHYAHAVEAGWNCVPKAGLPVAERIRLSRGDA